MEKKESYIVIDGVRYDAVKQEGGTLGVCQGCVFDGCTLPKIDGFSIDCGEDTTFVSRGEVAAQQRLTERNEERKPGVGKRSYYGFPNGVEAEDICRYLSFNLGNVVRYACRVERMDGYKKIEDLEKAKDYLDNEIERLREEFGNEIQRMKDKIAKEKKGDD